MIFTLRGRLFELTKADVESRIDGIPPNPTRKYVVKISGRPYPPKQLLAVALKIPHSGLTSQDANRILRGLGFCVEERGAQDGAERTESEVLFEEYLRLSGYRNFQFEPKIPNTEKRLDYILGSGQSRISFEVKEFRATTDDFLSGADTFDPYRPIREKIDAARKKFKDIKGFPCCLVLYNTGKPLVDLEWRFIYGAMLGNLGVMTPIDLERGGTIEEKSSAAFLGGGSMLRYQNGVAIDAQNTKISAIIVLRLLRVGLRRFTAQIRTKERQLGHKLGVEGFVAEVDRARATERDIHLAPALCSVVCENPYACKRVPPDLFAGPYDERYGIDSAGKLHRLYAGESLVELERLEGPHYEIEN